MYILRAARVLKVLRTYTYRLARPLFGPLLFARTGLPSQRMVVAVAAAAASRSVFERSLNRALRIRNKYDDAGRNGPIEPNGIDTEKIREEDRANCRQTRGELRLVRQYYLR